MSWLSELFGGSGEDPEAVRQRAAGQQAELARQAAAAQAQQQQQFEALMATLRPPEPAPVDPRIAQRADLRSNATTAFNNTFAPGVENSYIPDTLDDNLAGTVYGEQRGKADDYLNNLFKRGVITETGRAAGATNLDEQGARVRTQLNDLGSGLLNAERGKITDILGKGRDAASTVDIGQTFDPSVFANMINQNVGDFNSNFSDSFRAGVPGNLFDTSGLSAIAGGAQGAGNNAFDPNAVSAGVIGSASTDETNPNNIKATPKRTTAVF